MQQADAAIDHVSFVEGMKAELMRITQNEDNRYDAFIVYSDLKAIWIRSRVQTLLKLCCRCPNSRLDRLTDVLIEHHLKIISILIQISWTQWPKFLEVFTDSLTTWNEIREVGRDDSCLPFTQPDLKLIMGRSDWVDFDFRQWFFLPIRIGEQRSSTQADYTEDHRLPVLRTALLGSGASGVVYKELIAPGCLAVGDSWNAEGIEVARKHIEARDDFDLERAVIERLKNNSVTHGHITQCHGIVVRQGRPDNKLDIFYELASTNLGHFLLNWNDVPPSAEIQSLILQQTYWLIDALVFCHESIYDPEHGEVFLAHNDLKPENILVFFRKSDSDVGTWKIADFGLSKIGRLKSRQFAENDALPTPGNLTGRSLDQDLSRATRPPGAYTAPEIVQLGSLLKDSSSVQCDVWSLGCILAQILVFSTGGSQAVKQFNQLRMPGNSYNYPHDRYFEGISGSQQFRLKQPLFETLLELRRTSVEKVWVHQLVDLVFDILCVDKSPNGHGKILGLGGCRPKASYIRNRFRQVQNSHRSQIGLQLKASEQIGNNLPKGKLFSAPNSTPGAGHNTGLASFDEKERKASVASSSFSSVSDSTSSTSEQTSPHRFFQSAIVIPPRPPPGPSLGEQSKQDSVMDQTSSPVPSIAPRPSISPSILPVRVSGRNPSIRLSLRSMKAVELSTDAKLVVLWSGKQVVVYSLSSPLREQLFEFNSSSEQRRVHSVTIFGSCLAVTIGSSKSDEIKFFHIMDHKHRSLESVASESLVLGEIDHFRRVLLGVNGMVALVFSNHVEIGILREGTKYENLQTVDARSVTEYFFQPSISLNGHRLVVCSRDSKVPQQESWHFMDLSVPPGEVEDLVLQNTLPHADLQWPTAPEFLIPFQNTAGFYYRNGAFALFEGIKPGCTFPKNLSCAAATGSGPDHPERQYIVYVSQSERIMMSRTEVWCAEIRRSGQIGGGVESKKPIKLLALPGKQERPSLGFNWVKNDDTELRVYCVFVAFPDGSVWCLELPGVKPRSLY